MLFLLRQIRRKTLMNNKFTTYLLYAIGEIILVVVGILIALKIDSTYQANQTKELEIKYLKEMRGNLIFDLNDIDFNINFNQKRFNSNKIVLAHLRARLPYHDSLDYHFSNLVFSTRTLPNEGAYESLKGKGLEIISNDSLRKNITTLHEFDYYNAIDFEIQDDHPFQFDVLWPEVIKAIEIDSLGKAAKPINYSDLQKNIPFKNALASNLSYRKLMLDLYHGLKKKVSSLILFIEEELIRLEKI